jgi:hypothetical protein
MTMQMTFGVLQIMCQLLYVVLFQSYVFLQPNNDIKEGFNILLLKNGITCMKKHVDAKKLEILRSSQHESICNERMFGKTTY